MPISYQQTVTLYRFDELDSDAQEKAREWYRSCIDSCDFDATLEDIDAIAAILGVRQDTTRVRLMSGAYRDETRRSYGVGDRGEYFAFIGRWSYAKGAAKRVRECAPNDTELAAIADALQRASRKAFYRPWAILTDGWRGRSQSIAIEDCPCERVADELESALRDLSAWALSRMNAEYEYVYSDEYVDDCIRANEYTFDESGNRQD